jgi:hypothetical protein
MVRASDCQCTSCNDSWFDPSIRRHSEIWGAAVEAVLNIVRKKIPPKIFKKQNIYFRRVLQIEFSTSTRQNSLAGFALSILYIVLLTRKNYDVLPPSHTFT